MASNDTPDPMSALKEAGQGLFKALGDKALSTVTDQVGGLTDKLEGIADGSGPVGKAVAKGGEAAAQGDSAVGGAVKGAFSGLKDKVTGGGGGDSGGGEATKSTNIIETIDVGVPVSVAYNQWTEFGAFPTFMKKVEAVDAEEDNKLEFKAQIFLSHRTWEATILEQVPDERIVWRSKGEKGHVDGAVTFHELAPNLTRILVVLEYYPQGFFEKTGNLWRAQGRRARAELRHFRRHVMTRTILEEAEGWRGVIEDGEVVQSHEEVLEEEEAEQEEAGQEEDGEAPEDEESGEDVYDDEEEPAEDAPEEDYEDEDLAEEDEEEPAEDEDLAEEEPAEEDYEEEPADEDEELPEEDYEEPAEDDYEEEPADDEDLAEQDYEDEDLPEDEADEPAEDEAPPRRRRRRAS